MLVQPALVEYQKLTGARLDRGDVCKLFVSGVQVDGNAKLSTYVLPSGEPTGVVIQVHAHARAHARARDPRCVQACSTRDPLTRMSSCRGVIQLPAGHAGTVNKQKLTHAVFEVEVVSLAADGQKFEFEVQPTALRTRTRAPRPRPRPHPRPHSSYPPPPRHPSRRPRSSSIRNGCRRRSKSRSSPPPSRSSTRGRACGTRSR